MANTPQPEADRVRPLGFVPALVLAVLTAPWAVAADVPLPEVPAGFRVEWVAREPLVRNPCSMAFDARGRLFVGMGPQYRNPKPDTPGDGVFVLTDRDGDGTLDTKHRFATGFNCIQGLAWHGRDLWVANAPDLSIVRDTNGDDVADEYVRVYTDLGNLEHGLHGLNWGPDGRLYMSKGNSKGLTKPGRIAPRPFRELWGVTAPEGSPDFPSPQTFRPEDYRHAYHDPADDWGREGGILVCDDGGRNLEIVSRGFRNPWDIAFDSGFHWQGTDNDQTEGDRVFMPFLGAHFGWGHPWSSHWTGEDHLPTAPICGPVFHGSGTGIVYYDAPQFPPEHRGVWFFNDWLRRTTFVYRPIWDGALIQPEGGEWREFVRGGKALFKPTDLEVGPDGALYILGWGNAYGVEWSKDGEQSNEGRIARVSWIDAPPRRPRPESDRPISDRGVESLLADFDDPLPVRRIDAQDELVRRGESVRGPLETALRTAPRSEARETWTVWTLGRIAPLAAPRDRFFSDLAAGGGINLRIQALRILAHRARHSERPRPLPAVVQDCLADPEPRIRFAAVQAIQQAEDAAKFPALLSQLERETDRVTFYSGWQALRRIAPVETRKSLLGDERAGVRRAALLALAEDRALHRGEVEPLLNDPDAEIRTVAALRLGRIDPRRAAPGDKSGVKPRPLPPLGESAIYSVEATSGQPYRSVAGGVVPGEPVYTDRGYTFAEVPDELLRADVVRTANEDSGSRGDDFLRLDAAVPLTLFVGHDTRIARPPAWLRRGGTDGFTHTPLRIRTSDATFALFRRTVEPGRVVLGGNTDDGRSSGHSQYLVLARAAPLPRLDRASTIAATLPLVEAADPARGRALFHAAGCAACHRLDPAERGFGPLLAHLAPKNDPRHVVQSILEPSAFVTEGFSTHVLSLADGRVVTGLLRDETSEAIRLAQADGSTVAVSLSDVDDRRTLRVSAMPPFDRTLTPQQTADVAAFLLKPPPRKADGNQKPGVSTGPQPAQLRPLQKPDLSPPGSRAEGTEFQFTRQPGRLDIALGDRPFATYVFDDSRIPRPYFAHVREPGGIQVTRNHPPGPGDPQDHATFHPGLFLAFGDLKGSDFWRLKARVVHDGFIEEPIVTEGRGRFAVRNRYLTADGQATVCIETCRYTFVRRPTGVLIDWDSAFESADGDFHFGDQEEMGLGVRVASPLREQGGNGRVRNSEGTVGAGKTWGQPASWCDYSGTIDSRFVGVTTIASPDNVRPTWWHNRDYGVFVANLFGRQAMRQGAASRIDVKRGETFRLRYGLVIHGTPDEASYSPAAERDAYLAFLREVKKADAADNQADPPRIRGTASVEVKRPARFPHRIWAACDFEAQTPDYAWFGPAETKNIPEYPGNATALGVKEKPYRNFSALMTGINPVPGPMMGRSNKLYCRYFLRGGTEATFQHFSLSIEDNSHIRASGLTEGSWSEVTLDFTRDAARNDGSPRPFQKGERMDDFKVFVGKPGDGRDYDLTLDDVIFFDDDADMPPETEPFPNRVIFLAAFDTGIDPKSRPKYWPGAFDVVTKSSGAPDDSYWGVVRAVPHKETGGKWVRVEVRPPRPVGVRTKLRFRYHLAGASAMTVQLFDVTDGDNRHIRLNGLKEGAWQWKILDFTSDARRNDGSDTPFAAGHKVDDLFFFVKPDAGRNVELHIDEITLFDAGK